MLAVLIQRGHDAGKTNDLGPGTDHGHDFEFLHGIGIE